MKKKRVITEERKAQMRAYNAANKAKVSEITKLWKKSNKGAEKVHRRRYLKSLAKDYTVVYMLPCGYVGMTNQPILRMQQHRSVGRVTEGYVLLATCPTKEEARDLEALYQSLNNLTVDDNTRLRPIL